MSKMICKILGVIFMIVGLIGFAMPNLLGMHLTAQHNIIHLISGVLALYFGFFGLESSTRMFALTFGAVYLLLGIAGFIIPGTVALLVMGHEMTTAAAMTPDNAVHLLLGALFLIGGLVRSTRITPIDTTGGRPAHS